MEAEVERDYATSSRSRCYLFSAQQFAAIAGAHWGVESRLHRALDVVFHHDPMRPQHLNRQTI